MKTRVLRPVITLSAVTAVLVAALAVYAYMNTGVTHAAGPYPFQYNPVATVKYCNDLPNMDGSDPTHQLNGGNGTCTENLQQGFAADFTSHLDIPAPDANFSSVITFSPPGTTITPGCSVTPVSSCGAGTLPAGTKIGGLHSEENLGLANGACNTTVSVDFVLYSVALPNNTSNPRLSTNIAWPRQPGDSHEFNGWTTGTTTNTTPLAGGTVPANVNGINAIGTADAIQNYPSYLLNVFSASPGGAPIIPTAVYGGMTLVAGADWIPLYFVQFKDTDVPALNALGGGLHISQQVEGAPSVSVLVDPSAAASPSSITDYCTGNLGNPGGGDLLITTMLLGTSPDGKVRATSPATGGTCTGTALNPSTEPGCNAYGLTCPSASLGVQCTKFVTTYTSSQRDLDQDGVENQLDTCPTVPNISGDPRDVLSQSANGADNGIDGACSSGLPVSNDVDGDGFMNRQDNCPTVNNPSQTESELGVIQADNGPSDGMGDACDLGTVSVAQNNNLTGTHAPNLTINLGGTSLSVAHGRYIAKTLINPKCFGQTPAGGVDADHDGYCSTEESPVPAGSDNDPARHKAWNILMRQSNSGDTDGDGVSDAMETYLGTDATHSCAQTGYQSAGVTHANDEGPVDNWAFDFNDDGAAGQGDILQYSSANNNSPFLKEVTAAPGSSGVPMTRFDLNNDGMIDMSDVLQFASAPNGVPFGKVCGPGTSTATQPGVIWAVGTPMSVPVSVPGFVQQ
jgi:Thrombospondin type 3 repeat